MLKFFHHSNNPKYMGGTTTEILWDRLRIDLKSLHDGDYVSLAPVLAALNALIDPSKDYQRILKCLNFLNFELASSLADEESQTSLIGFNEFFFHTKSFMNNSSHEDIGQDSFLIDSCLKTKNGHPLVLIFLYIWLCQQHGFQASALDGSKAHIVKLKQGQKDRYVHLGLSGQFLSLSELTRLFNGEPQTTSATDSVPLTPISTHQFLKKYLIAFSSYYDQISQTDTCFHREKIIIWSLYLELDPNYLPFLEKRGLAYYNRGERKHASFDLKRFFSFTNFKEAPIHLKRAYYEVCDNQPADFAAFKAEMPNNPPNNTLLH